MKKEKNITSFFLQPPREYYSNILKARYREKLYDENLPYYTYFINKERRGEKASLYVEKIRTKNSFWRLWRRERKKGNGHKR